MRYIISLITALSLSACQSMPWIKEQVPDYPICRHLDQKITKKVIDGKEYVLARPNPTCMNGMKAKGKVPAVAGIKEPKCGFCVWTLSEKAQLVGDEWNHLLQVGKKKKRWSTIQEEGLTMPAETQAAIKGFSINICRISGACADEIDRLRIKFDALDSVGQALH